MKVSRRWLYATVLFLPAIAIYFYIQKPDKMVININNNKTANDLALPLEKRCYELYVAKSLSTEGLISDGLYNEYPYDISQENHGNIYIADKDSSRIFIFENNGAYRTLFGKRGNGPGDLIRPLKVLPCKDYINIYDSGNSRISTFNKDGIFQSSFRIYNFYCDIAISKKGEYFAIPAIVQPEYQKGLIHRLSSSGELIKSFGQIPPDINAPLQLWGRIAINNEREEIYLLYINFLIVQIFNFDGELLKEVKIVNKDKEIKKRKNIDNFKKKNYEGPMYQLADAIEATERGFMISISHPRVVFEEYDNQGILLNCYWRNSNNEYSILRDFSICESNGLKRFIVCYEGKYQPIEILEEKQNR